MDVTKETLAEIFTYHPPTPAQQDAYTILRAKARELASVMLDVCPPSAERTLALRKLQETVMWANASIAING